MESNNYERFITETVESFLPRFTDPKVWLTMVLKFEWTDHGFNKAGTKRVRPERTFRKIYLLAFNRPSNYTKVMLKDVSNERVFGRGNNAQLVMDKQSDHDSCWRSDGMAFVFKTFMEAWDYFDQFGIEGRDIDPMVGYDLSGSPAYYECNLTKCSPRNDADFKYYLDIGRRIHMSEISEFMPKEYP